MKRNIKAGEIKIDRRTSQTQQNLMSLFKKWKVTVNKYDIGWEHLFAAKKQVNNLVFRVFFRKP